MRPLALAVLLLALPLAGALPEHETRDVTANHVYPTRCPSYSTPATVGCFEAPAGATLTYIELRPLAGNAQPRMLVWVYEGERLLQTRWMCDDGHVGAAGMTDVVVTLQPDRDGCSDERLPFIGRGNLTLRWT